MAKLRVLDSDQQGSTPFLRGILIHRLQESGLSFDESFRLAASVREALSDKIEVSTQELRELVGERLRDEHGDTAADRYLQVAPGLASLLIREEDGSLAPFSRSQLRRKLEASGLGFEETLSVVSEVYDQLVRTGETEFLSAELGRRTYDQVRASISRNAADRYLAWIHHMRSDRPLILLVGGVPGSGKSTISSEVAHRLEVVRIQSTDMVA